MLLSPSRPLSNTYSVEVSGWDDSHSFFVEKSELFWNEETGKHITLARSLSPGAMIFERLLQPTSLDHSSPVAYWTEPVATAAEGRQQFRLNRVEPRGVSTDESSE